MLAYLPLKRLGHQIIWGLGLQDALFRLREWKMALGAEEPASPDGKPTPPAILRVRVCGTAVPSGYFQAGREILAEFDMAFIVTGGGFETAKRVVDIGCGVARMARWLPASVETVGIDIDRTAIGWCQKNLPGDWRVVDLGQPAPVESGSADLIYACSVITHLREPTARAWMADVARMLKPGGRALITFHDPVHPNTQPVAETLARDGYAVRFDSLEGSNHLSAFVTPERLRDLAGPLEMVLLQPSPDTRCGQAIAVFRKPG